MNTTSLKRAVAASLIVVLPLIGTACSTDSTSSSATTSVTSSVSDSSDASTSTTADTPDLATLQAEVTDLFEQYEYTDAETGETLPYNLYLPEDYDPSQSYPLVLYIADSSLVGQDVTAPLSQYGALIWASEDQQAEQESIVLVPEYPEVIIDDHGSYTTTDYVEMTARLVESISSEYSVDPDRVYGTGQSMGCMTVMALAAAHPELFAAELFVSGQWDITQLQGLEDENFFYIAAGGDENASGGQEDVKAMLDEAGVAYNSATWDATWTDQELADAADELLAAGDSINFATFTAGTVLEASGSTGSDAMSSEHMASFQPAYEISALRTWLLSQTA